MIQKEQQQQQQQQFRRVAAIKNNNYSSFVVVTKKTKVLALPVVVIQVQVLVIVSFILLFCFVTHNNNKSYTTVNAFPILNKVSTINTLQQQQQQQQQQQKQTRSILLQTVVPTTSNNCIHYNHLVSKKNTVLSATSNNNDNNEGTTSTTVVIERPDPSILLSSQTNIIQRIGFGSIVIGLYGGTVVCVNGLTLLQNVLPYGWYEIWRDYTWTIPMGILFVAAGISHFLLKDTFLAMVPPIGTWGNLWQIPSPYNDKLNLSYAEYHTYWTGIAEIVGGLLLLLSSPIFNVLPVQIPATLILLLLICVTPANIYMGTHDIQVPNLPQVPYPAGHIVRGILQCVLLSIFWKLIFQ